MKLFFKRNISLGANKTALAGTVVDVPDTLADQALEERSDAVFLFDPSNEQHKAADAKSAHSKPVEMKETATK